MSVEKLDNSTGRHSTVWGSERSSLGDHTWSGQPIVINLVRSDDGIASDSKEGQFMTWLRSNLWTIGYLTTLTIVEIVSISVKV